MGSPFGLLASGAFFVAVGVGAIVVEQRWPGGILSLLLAAVFLLFGTWMLIVRSRSDDESRDPTEPA
jgi:hypothetical protein